MSLTPGQMSAIKLIVALSGMLLLSWGRILRRLRRPESSKRLRDGILLALGLFAALCWWNLFEFHFPSYLHTWDVYHEYVGSKYFAELGYTRLYRCTTIADAEDGVGPGGAIRDLTTNELESSAPVLLEPARCTQHFTSERWSAFKHDVAWFRDRMTPRVWAAVKQDHGYNATPVWGMVGSALAQGAPASRRQLLLLTLIDPLLLLAMWGCVVWAFGWRTACVALVYWGTQYPADFSWNGGAYLRQDWLALSVIGLCLLRRQRSAAGGFALAWASLLRLFPAVIVSGIILKAAARMWRRRTIALSAEDKRFALGFALAILVLVPVSAVAMGGWSAWGGFFENTSKHANTPLTNDMGLKTVVSYEASTRARVFVGLEEHPFEAWKLARRHVFEERRFVFVVMVLGFVLLLARAVARGEEDWVAALLGIGVIVMAIEVTCYYYSILLAYAFLWTRRETVGIALCGLAAVSQAVPMILTWSDDRFTAISVVVIAFIVMTTAMVAFEVTGATAVTDHDTLTREAR